MERWDQCITNVIKTDVDAGFRHTRCSAATESDVDRVRRPRMKQANRMSSDDDKDGIEARVAHLVRLTCRSAQTLRYHARLDEEAKTQSLH